VVLKVGKCPTPALALSNFVFLHPDDYGVVFRGREPVSYLKVAQYVWTAASNPKVDKGTVGFNSTQRLFAMLSLDDPIDVTQFSFADSDNVYLLSLDLEVRLQKKSKAPLSLNSEQLSVVVKQHFDLQFMCVDQQFFDQWEDQVLVFRVSDIQVGDLRAVSSLDPDKPVPALPRGAGSHARGLITQKTVINFTATSESNLIITGSGGKGTVSFKTNFDFKKMEIGGLDDEFSAIFRRAFASRCVPQSVVSEMGLKHIRGILLYGPPGTGKTLMARQIGKMLDSHDPKIVNGPEILGRYVGESEENIRKLFVDAEKEYREKGDSSKLHIIIFDELDAICKQRGTVNSGTAVHDTVVNQLLSKIDGVDAINNILIIGMTNRKDMLDDALLRPGRLEVQIEIGLPDEKGRLQIFSIHTTKIRTSGHTAADVDLCELASITKNFTGAEIEGVVKAASSFAFQRQIDPTNPTAAIDQKAIIVTRDDFLRAITEVAPKFGVTEDEFSDYMRQGVIEHGPRFHKIIETGRMFIQQVQNSSRTPLVSVLLEGTAGTGKTALAVHLAMSSQFPLVKILSPDKLLNYSEASKAQQISKDFTDSYKSPLSVIVLDDIERLVEYVRIGPRFSNLVLQTLMVLLKKIPEKGRKLLIIATTSSKHVLEDLGLLDCFNAVVNVPTVNPGAEVNTVLKSLAVFTPNDLKAITTSITQPIAIKKLLMTTEMAIQGDKNITIPERFVQCMEDYGVDYNY